MRKLILFLGFLLMAHTALAGLVTYDDLSSDAGVTYVWFNDKFGEFKTVLNGNVESINIKDGTIASQDISTATSPLIRDNENIGEYVYSGLTIANSASTDITIAAGVAYVTNDAEGLLHRVATASTNKTVTGTMDTWIYLDFTGAFVYSEVAVGAAQPTTPSNSILIALASNAAGTTTTITDKRQTTPSNLRIYSNYRQGVYLSYDTATTIKLISGDIEFGGTAKMRKNTSNLALAWTDLDAGSEAAATYYYVWAYPSTANSVNYSAKISASKNDPTGITNERLIGWFYNDEADTSNISQDSVGSYKGDGSNSPNIVTVKKINDYTATATTVYADSDLIARVYLSGRPVKITSKIMAAAQNNGGDCYSVISIDTVGCPESESAIHSVSGYAGTYTNFSSLVSAWSGYIAEGTHTIKIRVRGSANSIYKGRILTIEEL